MLIEYSNETGPVVSRTPLELFIVSIVSRTPLDAGVESSISGISGAGCWGGELLVGWWCGMLGWKMS